mmetsp:Transcript_31691/g.57369  ORF Transcript_31691/g.57369 Transcript_31691/m.57369 type:complete len:372 (+) Transcript_31691:2976-4091(+)
MHYGDQMTPIVSVSKDDFTYERPDVNLLLQLAGIDDPPAILLFIDDMKEMLGNDTEEGSPSRSVSLVDHNTLNKSLRHFNENLIVVEIVDHHKDEKQYKKTCEHRNIAFDNGHALVASTTTLVAERLQEYHPTPYPSSIGILLLGVILLDSVNLDESVGKVTQRDEDAVRDLLLHTDWSTAMPSSYLKYEDNGDITVDTNGLFKKLQQSKYDPKFWSSLSVERALRYDYKDFHSHGFLVHALKKQGRHKTNFGIASILMPGLDFMNADGFYDSTLAFMESVQIPFLGIMFAFYDEQEVFHRQLAFISFDQTVSLRELVGTLRTSHAYKSVDLQLEEVHLPAELRKRKNVCLFDQNNLSPSRKQIGPMLEDF